MLRIIAPFDNGNAPKQTLLRNFTVALAEKNVGFILEALTESVRWENVGTWLITGKADVEALLNEESSDNIAEVNILTIITHGRAGAVHGTVAFQSGRKYSFCDVYLFDSLGKNAKIKEITSYIIET